VRGPSSNCMTRRFRGPCIILSVEPRSAGVNPRRQF
jgi:hypothetical protein